MMRLRVIPAQPDESLSSWLIRIALSYSCDPNTIAWQAWGESYRAWTVDFERYLTNERISKLAKAINTPYDKINEMLLFNLALQHSSTININSGIWAWIMTQGTRNRKKAIGQAFCSLCFSEDSRPYLRRNWRTAWATTCTKHNIILQSQCPQCGYFFIPSRLKGFERKLCICYNCKHDLSKIDYQRATSKFQVLAEQAILTNKISYNDQIINSVEWFDIARAFSRILRKVANNPNSHFSLAIQGLLKQPIGTLIPTATGGMFEWLPLNERHEILAYCYRLMHEPLENIIEISQFFGVSQNAYYHAMCGDVPSTLLPLISVLPKNNREYTISHNITKPKSQISVMRKWARLQRKIEREMHS